MRSLGYRTDLALLALGGSTLEQREDHVVVRTPDNPLHWWGNFLLLPRPPAAEQTGRWLDRFAAEIPDARHVAFGVDGTDGRVEDLRGMTDAGLHVEAATVMTATTVTSRLTPTGAPTSAGWPATTTGPSWSTCAGLQGRPRDGRAYREFCRAQGGQQPSPRRAPVTARGSARSRTGGCGRAWACSRASEGLARFQSVETHPDARGRRTGRHAGAPRQPATAWTSWARTTLVMVADPATRRSASTARSASSTASPSCRPSSPAPSGLWRPVGAPRAAAPPDPAAVGRRMPRQRRRRLPGGPERRRRTSQTGRAGGVPRSATAAARTGAGAGGERRGTTRGRGVDRGRAGAATGARRTGALGPTGA